MEAKELFLSVCSATYDKKYPGWNALPFLKILVISLCKHAWLTNCVTKMCTAGFGLLPVSILV